VILLFYESHCKYANNGSCTYVNKFAYCLYINKCNAGHSLQNCHGLIATTLGLTRIVSIKSTWWLTTNHLATRHNYQLSSFLSKF